MFSTLVGKSRSTIAGQRGLDERHFARNLRGELDAIVMKALEKDRTRHYDSADALAGNCAMDFTEVTNVARSGSLQKTSGECWYPGRAHFPENFSDAAFLRPVTASSAAYL